MRYAALNLAAELIEDRHLSEEKRDELPYWLDDLYSRRAAWGIVRVSVIAAATIAFRRTKPGGLSQIPQRLQPKFNAFILRWTLGVLSNSLAATTIFVLVSLVAVASSLSYGIFTSALANRHDHNGHNGTMIPHVGR
jgi:hypothetical protein